jgi:hypothetical protein
MNAMRRFLTGAAVTVGALGIGAAAIGIGCDSDLNRDVPVSAGQANGAERKAPDAKYNDGDYTFYFKNGKNVHGDCDGYNSDAGGKTTIYEYYQSDINDWEKRLKAAGVALEATHRTSKPGKYCWTRFDTNLLYGIGYEGYESINLFHTPNGDILMNNGTRLNFKKTEYLHYARAHEGFIYKGNADGYRSFIQRASRDQEKRDAPAIILSFSGDSGERNRNSTAHTLEAAGISIIEKGRFPDGYYYLIVDASTIDWFAYDL